jgi:hypothetical protein
MRLVFLTFSALSMAVPFMSANTMLDPSAPNNLSLFNLGTVPDVAASYSNQVFYEGLAISGNNLLLSVGDPVNATQKVWSLPLVRVNNHIVSFGSPSVYAPVLGYPGTCCLGNTMAGGLVIDGGSLLYTTQFFSYLGEHSGGSPGLNNLMDLAGTGAATGGLQYVPSGFVSNGAGQLKMTSTCEPGSFGCSASGDWYTLNLAGSAGNRTLDSFTPYVVGVTAFSFDYVPVDNAFNAPGVVLGDSSQLRLDYYQVDSYGNPCNPNTTVSCAPIIHLVVSDIQVGLGVVRDPVTGDILFTTGDNQLWILNEAAPEPSSIIFVLCGIGAGVIRYRRVTSRRS